MHLIRRVPNVFVLVPVAILAALSLGPANKIRSAGTLFLDLTEPISAEDQLNVMPGGNIGGVAGRTQTHGWLLPLAVELRSISPQPVNASGKFIVELFLRNTSKLDFQMPSSRKSAAVLKQGNKGRRTFLFSLVFEDPVSHRSSSVIMAESVGSRTMPVSYLTVAPGQSVRILFNGDLISIRNWLGSKMKQIRVRAQISEWIFEDQRYFVESKSEAALSQNALSIDLALPE